MLNALTIDVEDYYQVENFAGVVKRSEWEKLESRVVRNARRILDILAEHGTKATFFVLGWVAERHPELVTEIDAAGHEIATHGYAHELVYSQSREEFAKDLALSITAIEKIINKKVIGYRAPSCSITKDSLWAFDIIKKAGLRYDASIFPIHHDRYGIPDAKRYVHRWDDTGLVEFPFSTLRVAGHNIPVAGGGYFRLYPYAITKWAIARINRDGYPAMVYVHPWEFDQDQPRIKVGRLAGFRHYVGIASNEKKLRRLLGDFKFGTVREILGIDR